MIVACSIDRHFAELAGVMLYSLDKNGGVPDAEIYVLSDGLRPSDKNMLQACTKRALRFVDVEGDILSKISRLKTTHAKPNTQECLHPEKATFLEYRRHTPWRKTRLQTRRDRRIRTLMLSVRKKWQRFWAASGFGAPSRVD